MNLPISNIENRKILSMIEERLESTFLCLLTVEDGRCESTSFDFQALETEDMNLLASLKQWKNESTFLFSFFVYQPRMEDVNLRLETEIVNLRFFFHRSLIKIVS